MCAPCGCGKKKGEPGYGKGKGADKKQDAKAMKGMSPAQKAKFEKEDKKMDK
jgi:hypothetical protein